MHSHNISRFLVVSLVAVGTIAAGAYSINRNQEADASGQNNKPWPHPAHTSALEQKKADKERGTSTLYIRNVLAVDGSVDIDETNPVANSRLYQVYPDGTLDKVGDLRMGYYGAPARTPDELFMTRHVYDGKFYRVLHPGDKFRVAFEGVIDGFTNCEQEFTIPNDFQMQGQANPQRVTIAASADLRGTVVPKEPTIIDTPHISCSRYEIDKVAKDYTGILVQQAPSTSGAPNAYPYALSIDDDLAAGGGGQFPLETRPIGSTQTNAELEGQIRSMYATNPATTKGNQKPVVYVTIKGRLGPEIKVGSNRSDVTTRHLRVESITNRNDTTYQETHKGILWGDPKGLLGAKYRLTRNQVDGVPFQPIHYMIPKNEAIDGALARIVGPNSSGGTEPFGTKKEVTVKGRRSTAGLGYFDVTEVTPTNP